MAIDIYAEWDGMTEDEKAAQITGFAVEQRGLVGCLHEDRHGEPYATKVLVPEAFQEQRAQIYADTLRDRLPATLVVAEQREREIYSVTDDAEINLVLKSYCEFVELCARKEAETGEPCLIIAYY